MPLVAGAVIPVDAVMDGPQLCPFLAVTGLPCPFCGATRAFVLFGHLDASWLDYGAVWVVVALLAIVFARRITSLRGQRGLSLLSTVAVVAVAWAWALAQSSTIS